MVANYNVIVVTENFWGTQRLIEIDELCRAQGKGFILSETLGVMSYAFLDYGPQFKVTDKDGEQTKQFIVSGIEKANEPTVHVHEDKRHTYQDGDFVKFVEVEGMTQLNDLPHIEIFDTKAYSFRLRVDASNFGEYTRQGIVEDIKVPKIVQFQSLADSLKNPAAATEFGMLEPLDMNYFGMGRSEQLHFALRGVHAFRDAEGRYPEANAADTAKVIDLVKGLNDSAKQSEGSMTLEEVDEKIVTQVANFSQCSITSQCAMFGGFIAQEIVKFTGKYMPLKQWAHYDCFESLPEGEADRTPMNCRYDD